MNVPNIRRLRLDIVARWGVGMRRGMKTAAPAILFATWMACAAVDAGQPRAIFNGRDLSEWDGDPSIWSVVDGTITGRTTAEKPIAQNTFLVWRGGDVRNFRLTLQYRIRQGNSGIHYRSKVVDPAKWIVAGYQADIEAGPDHTGILYEERGRGIVTKRGLSVVIGRDGARVETSVVDSAALQRAIRGERWNSYEVEAWGPHLRHVINGQVMSETTDLDEGARAESGILALQVHAGPPMTVEFRNLQLERLEPVE